MEEVSSIRTQKWYEYILQVQLLQVFEAIHCSLEPLSMYVMILGRDTPSAALQDGVLGTRRVDIAL